MSRPIQRAVLILAALTIASCHPRAKGRAIPTPPAGTVWLTPAQVTAAHLAVEAVGEKPVGTDVSASGRLTFHDLHVAHVFSPVTGRVVRLDAAPGNRVRHGDSLAIIDSPDIGNTYADFEKAQGDLRVAQQEMKRQKELRAAHAGVQRDLEIASASLNRARAELERASEKARLLRAGGATSGTEDYALRAPIDGEVLARNVNPGSEVQGQYGSGNAVELFTVGDLDPIVVMADVFERDIGRVKVGAAMAITVPAYPGRVFHGSVDWVADQLDPTTRAARVRGLLSNEDRALKAEMYAAVSIVAQRRLALAIPRPALLRLRDQTVVFVETGGAPDERRAFTRRVIAVEDEGGQVSVPLKRGLVAGDRVVTSGAILLSGMVP